MITQQTLEPFRAQGLHSAMYIIPALGLLLTLVLFAGSRTVTKDMERLHTWMRQSASLTSATTGAADASAENAQSQDARVETVR